MAVGRHACNSYKEQLPRGSAGDEEKGERSLPPESCFSEAVRSDG